MVLPCIYTNFYYMPFIFNIIIHFTFFCVSSIPTLLTCLQAEYLARLNVHWKKYLEYRFLMLSYKNIYLWYTKYVLIGTPLFWGSNHLIKTPIIVHSNSTGMGGVVHQIINGNLGDPGLKIMCKPQQTSLSIL